MAKISYLDGIRFYNAFAAGGYSLIQQKAYLNEINVFPVADADTGTNLVSTINSILNKSHKKRSLRDTIKSMSDSALMGARGNSGIIFAQFLVGLSKELGDHCCITMDKFAEGANKAMTHVYDSITEPVEGTILTVMRVWSEAIKKYSLASADYCNVLTLAYSVTQEALENTPNQLEILKEAGVVDAGAQGFVSFLAGVMKFIQEGSIKNIQWKATDISQDKIISNHADLETNYRYCTEAVISDSKIDVSEFKRRFRTYGDSLIIAGSKEKMHLHIHTDSPDKFFYEVKDLATIKDIKVDDMYMQYQVSHNRRYPIGIITDSACDLPDEIIEKYQIQQISFGINFGDYFLFR
ncbi:DAK2 domain-containing protein [Maridesulfovibrio ferrireducens]|uniref:DAK2 domain-containing protein n=1 Tax=Maridesulfovibrio ferrireducens TaxID=246191 RepID=UPI001A1F488F|nr:DAK2 domain-containing protein [Maridesulfovibrio ferrireducens]MBI9113204.1 DAK2 domain-containing protein [Maridesulfovibrio ferrireducens]